MAARRIVLIVLVVALACLLGFAGPMLVQDEEISQTLAGRLVVKGKLLTGEVKVLSRSENACNADGTVALVDKDGRFHMVRTVKRGKLAVIVQKELICFRQSGAWELVWQARPHGPASNSMTVDCVKTDDLWKCRVVNEWGVDIAREW